MGNVEFAWLAAAGLVGLILWGRGRPTPDLIRCLQLVAMLTGTFYLGVWAYRYAPFDLPYSRSTGWALGNDFPVYYCMAKLAPAGGPDLYNFELQNQVQSAAIGLEHPFLPALYPPFVFAACRPLGGCGYIPAYFVFAGTMLGLMVLTAAAWFRRSAFLCGPWRRTALIVFAGCPMLWESLLDGQAAAVGCTSFGLAAACSLGGPPWFLPLLLALAAYKPPAFALAYSAVLLRWPRAILPTLAAVAALVAWGGLAEGWDSWTTYVVVPWTEQGGKAVSQPPAEWFHGLANTTPWTRNWLCRGVFFAAGLAAAWRVALRWRQFPHGDRGANAAAFGLLGTIGLLCNPYVPLYDLTLLLPITACVAEAGMPIALGMAALGMAALYFGPFFARVFCSATDVQLFPFVLLAFGAVQWRAFFARERKASPAPLPAGAERR